MKNNIRINKYLSLCGLGSRRKVEEFVKKRKIKINGNIIDSLSLSVDPDHDVVEFENETLNIINKKYFIILNKPKGYITSYKDEKGRPIVMDLIPEKYKRSRISPVGRLDKNSEGLLLLTNYGNIAYRLTHPKFGVKKQYIVELNKQLKEEDKHKIEKGVFLYGEKTNSAEVELIDNSNRMVKITISEGKKRHIRLTFNKLSYKVKKLKRISFGPIKLGNLSLGSHRLLRKDEIKKLLHSVNLEKSTN